MPSRWVRLEGFVPVVDLAATRTPDPVLRREAARAIGNACRESGFLVITRHGVPAPVLERLMTATKAFFALPEDLKLQVAADPDDPLMRGFVRDTEPAIRREQGPGAAMPESFVVNWAGEPAPGGPHPTDVPAGLCVANRWPQLEGFRAALLDYFAVAERLAAELLELLALALDLPAEWFRDAFEHNLSSLAANYYPGPPVPPSGGEIRKGPHTDWGALTVLYKEDSARGLQLVDAQGDWVDVPPISGSFVINIGDLMSDWTNGMWRSTVHRVVHLGDEAEYGDRYSVALFYQPRHDAEIGCLPGCDTLGRSDRRPSVSFGDYLAGKLRRAHVHRRLAAGGQGRP